jgi:hypothetical protein
MSRIPSYQEHLEEARREYIAKLRRRSEHEEACMVLVPAFRKLWAKHVSPDPTTMPVFGNYVWNYSPQLIENAIFRVARHAPKIRNYIGYFKQVVRDMREKEFQTRPNDGVTHYHTSNYHPTPIIRRP